MADVPAVANTAVTNDGAEDASMAETNAQFVLQIPPIFGSHEYIFFVFPRSYKERANK